MIAVVNPTRPTAPFEADTYSVLVILTLPLGLYPFYLRKWCVGALTALATLVGWALLATGLIVARPLMALLGGLLLLGLLIVGLRQAGRAYAVTERLNRQNAPGPQSGTPTK